MGYSVHDQQEGVLLEVQLMHGTRRRVEHARAHCRRPDTKRDLVVAGRAESPVRLQNSARIRGSRGTQVRCPSMASPIP
jgi:hypothetical protein